MPQYLLQTGNTPTLTFYEAQAVIGQQVELVDQLAVLFNAEADQTAIAQFKLLGAAVRLVKVERDWQKYSANQLTKTLGELLTAQASDKLQFAVAQWGQTEAERISLTELKKALTAQQIKTRFIEGARRGLSAAVLLHQPVTELVVWQRAEQVLIGRTLAVQDIDYWTTKDRQKPYADRKKGMLPPKVARAMVNLAIGSNKNTRVYDPFCGTGTILIEALERGCRVVGSDADNKAVVGAQANLAWFADLADLPPDFTIFRQEAAHASPEQVDQPVDAIVTEPFLGKPQAKPEQLAGIFKGLEKLYLGAFRQWRSILHKGSKIVMVFPRVELASGQVYDFRSFVDKLHDHGYTLQVDFGAISYARPQAQTQRDIIVLRLN
jgi:tRNA G10  N-methylase Trm11